MNTCNIADLSGIDLSIADLSIADLSIADPPSADPVKKYEKTITDITFVNDTNWLGIKCEYGSALISNDRLCCEDWGIKINGKEFRDTAHGTVIGTTRTEFKHTGLNETREDDYYEAEFTAGELGSCKVWCDHNGYYPHDVLFEFGSYMDGFEL
jgi:uncharacterized protein YjbI with pentapeptide repeats